MNSIIKNVSKVLALATLFTNFSSYFVSAGGNKSKKCSKRQSTSTTSKAKKKSASRSSALITNLKGSHDECRLCREKFHSLNECWKKCIVLDETLIKGTSAPVVLRILKEFESLLETYKQFKTVLFLNRLSSEEPLIIKSFNAALDSSSDDTFIPTGGTTLPLGTVSFGGLDKDYSDEYINNRNKHYLSHFDDNRAIESHVSHEFAHAMLVLYAEQAVTDQLSDGGDEAVLRLITNPFGAFDAEIKKTHHAVSKCIWDRLTSKIPALADSTSQLNIDLGKYRFRDANEFYAESLAELFAYARNSSRATEALRRAVFEEFNALFPDLSVYPS